MRITENRDVGIWADSKKLLFGAGQDASIYYDGTDLFIDSGEVGSGSLKKTDGTNIVEIEDDGDIVFIAGAGLQHGCVNYHGAGVNTTCTVQNTWYQITAFDNNSESNGSVTPDHTNDHITVGKAGVYQIFLGMGGASTTANNTFEVSVFINNGATQITPITIHGCQSDKDWFDAMSGRIKCK
jgi:hypothetical protein